jgi:hypothetical protein
VRPMRQSPRMVRPSPGESGARRFFSDHLLA